jgi:hypothetical protein
MIIDQRVMELVETDIREVMETENISYQSAIQLYVYVTATTLLSKLLDLLDANSYSVPAGTIQQILQEDDMQSRFEYAKELRYRFGQTEL